jgi:DNA sulfur modification protein DndD
MILRKIEVRNFRQLFGTNEIEFAPPGDANVTIILGTNGAGKTTLLNAFLWCLYGHFDLQNPLEIISHKAVQEASVGGELEVSVRLVFEAEGRVHHASRTLRVQKKEGGRLERLNDQPLEVMTIEQHGRSEPAGDPVALVERLLPPPLSKFFFFRGEDMEQLALPGSGEKLKTGTETFFDFTVLDRSVKHLYQVGEDLEREIRESASGDAREISEQMEKVGSEIQDLRIRHNTVAEEVTALSDQRDLIERELSAIDETRPLLEERSRLLERQQSLEVSEDQHRERIAALVSENGYLVFSPVVLEEPLKLADKAVEKGELPAKIKPKFVDDLLQKQVCICERNIDPNAAAALLAYRAQTGLASLEEEILNLRGAVTRLADRREAFKQDIMHARVEYANTQQVLHETSLAISRIQSELQGKDFGLDQIKALQGKLRSKDHELVDAKVKVGQLE